MRIPTAMFFLAAGVGLAIQCQAQQCLNWSGLNSGDIGQVNSLVVHDDGTGPALYAATPTGVWRYQRGFWTLLGTSFAAHSLVVADDGSGRALCALSGQSGVVRFRSGTWSLVGSLPSLGVNWTYLAGSVNANPRLVVIGIGNQYAIIEGWNGSVWTQVGSTWFGNEHAPLPSTVVEHAGRWFVASGGVGLLEGQSGPPMGANLHGTQQVCGCTYGAYIPALGSVELNGVPTLFAGGDICILWCPFGAFAHNVAQLQESGEAIAMGTGLPGTTRCIVGHDDGLGTAAYFGGDSPWHVAKWNGQSWSAVGDGPNGSVRSMVSFDDGFGNALYAAGSFTVAGGVPAISIARWGRRPCYANCDGSASTSVCNTLNALDFSCFLDRFANGDNRANCDGSTAPPVLNCNDFMCFMNGFAAGCP